MANESSLPDPGPGNDPAAESQTDSEARTVPPAASVAESPEARRQRVSQVWGATVGAADTIASSLDSSQQAPEGARARRARVARDEPPEDPDENYELLQLLGEGGMGVVYAARQKSVDRVIALKRLREEGDQAARMRQKFLSEAIVTGDLEHPNIIPIYDVGHSRSGEVFYAMRQVKGRGWDERIDELDLERNLDILQRVADAVAFAHAKGIIHRDLKPENVMLGEFGEVVVMDWGLAASVSAEGKAQGLSATVAGTPMYMAPEMALAEPERIGPHSDVYLLGAILYEIVTGHAPHTGETVMACLQNAADNRIVETERDDELTAIARRALATDPAERYASVKAFQKALNEYRAHAESLQLFHRSQETLATARQTGDYDIFAEALFGLRQARELWPGLPEAAAWVSRARREYAEAAHRKGDLDLALSLLASDDDEHRDLRRTVLQARTERQARRRRLRLALRAAAALAALVFVILAVSFFWIRAEKARATRERNRAVAARREAERLAYLNAVALAESSIRQGEYATAAGALEDLPASLRNWEWGRLMALCHQDTYRVAVGSPGRRRLVLLPQAGLIATASEDERGVRLYRLADGESAGELPGTEAGLQDLAHDPATGRLLGAGWSGRVLVWDPTAAEVLFELRGHEGPVSDVAVAPDGSAYATSSLDGTVRLWDPVYGRELARARAGAGVVEVNLDAAGSVLARTEDGGLHLWERDGASLRSRAGPTEAKVAATAFGPVEGQILTASRGGEVLLWRRGEPRPLARLAGGTAGEVITLACRRPGGPVLASYADGTAALWQPGREGLLRRLRGTGGTVSDAVFDPAGRFVATAGTEGMVRFWRLRRNPATHTLRASLGNVSSLAAAPPGDRLLCGSWDGRTALRTAPEALQVLPLAGTSPVLDVALTRDGTRAALARADGSISLLQIAPPRLERRFTAHTGRVFGVAWSPDGALLLSGGEDHRAALWRADGTEQIAALEGHTGPVHAVTFSADGRSMLTGAWESFEKRLTEDDVCSLRLWRMSTGRRPDAEAVPLPYSKDVLAVAFGPGGDRAAVVSSEENAVLLWDLADRRVAKTLEGHRAGILSLAYSPDGRRLFTSDSAGTVKLWNVETGRELMELERADSAVYALALTADGRRLYGGLDGGRLRAWSALPWEAPPAARRRARLRRWQALLGAATEETGNAQE
jgi:WD40 repeat protein/tRNA A-37 threonylcarbamoyl transferase component Bud32